VPPETDGSSFYLQPALYGIALPAAVSAAVLLVTQLFARRITAAERTPRGGLALGAGYLVGQVAIDTRPPLPPREASDWIWYFTIAAILLGLADVSRGCPPWLRWLLRAVLWLAFVWVLLPLGVRAEETPGEVRAWLAGLGQAGLVFWALLDIPARRLPGASLPLTLLIVAAGSAVVLTFSFSAKLGQFAGAFAAAMIPVLVATWWRPGRPLATGPAMVILPGLWLATFFYATPQRTSLVLLAAAALSGGLGCVPGVRRLPPWARTLLSGVVAAALAAVAVWMARAAYQEAASDYTSSRIGSAPSAT
jgi:hypothetical protein